MARTDYYQDPTAPTANSIVVATSVFVQDAKGRVLLIRRSDSGLWSIPGGGQEIGETVAACAERETYEETGHRIRVTGLVGVYSDPEHVIVYDDGEVRQEFSLCFRAELVSGERRRSDESLSVEWVDPRDLRHRDLHPTMRLRIDHGLAHLDQPYIG